MTKHYSAKRMAQEIADAVVSNYESDKTYICLTERVSKGLAKELNAIISPLRTEVIRQAEKLVSEKTNAAWKITIAPYMSLPGVYGIEVGCWVVYTCD